MTKLTVRLQLDLRDFPAAARERLYQIASEQSAGTQRRVTLSDVCREALVAFAAPQRPARREAPPWQR